MPFMRAIEVKGPGAEFQLVQKEIPEPKEHEVLLEVQACGVCHGDAIVKEGQYYPGLQYPRTPGHEVVGTIAKLGSESHYWKIGQRVGVGWRGGHCLRCRSCLKGEFWACESPLATGISTDGGYAEYMTARMEVLTSIPDELSSVEAAPLLCAGATTLGALKNFCSHKEGTCFSDCLNTGWPDGFASQRSTLLARAPWRCGATSGGSPQGNHQRTTSKSSTGGTGDGNIPAQP